MKDYVLHGIAHKTDLDEVQKDSQFAYFVRNLYVGQTFAGMFAIKMSESNLHGILVQESVKKMFTIKAKYNRYMKVETSYCGKVYECFVNYVDYFREHSQTVIFPKREVE